MSNGWHSAAVIYKEEGGKFFFLVQDVRSLDPRWEHQSPQTKCVGGGREPEDEKPEDTLLREISQELAREDDGKIELKKGVNIHKLWTDTIDSHTRFFFLIWIEDLIGEMRTRDTDRVDGDSRLSNLRFIEESDIQSVVFRTHIPALVEALYQLHNPQHRQPSTLVG